MIPVTHDERFQTHCVHFDEIAKSHIGIVAACRICQLDQIRKLVRDYFFSGPLAFVGGLRPMCERTKRKF
jgi:hypothetical protein